ncbi:MAG TPA: VOC family protein [Solirubrobacteraceae bacterium]|jgi:catechol 2,3-dioxygenase-like lactoylglutathione lyase family enzyme
MVGRAELVAFLPSLDLDASDRFYSGVLGLPRVESTAFANAYDANGTPLRVTHVGELPPVSHTVLGWRVANVAAEILELRGAGVEFKFYDSMAQDEDGVWVSPTGARIAWFSDPDGNTLSLQQPSG